MKHKQILISALVVLILSLAVGWSRAQEPGPSEDTSPRPQDTTGVTSITPAVLPIQGRLTDTDGNPLDGTYVITATLYDADSGGTALCQDQDSVDVDNGLFDMHMNYCTSSDIDGKKLYLGIQVEDDPEMTPRQAIFPVPYAFSLRPGANISGTLSGDAILHIENWGTEGRGLRAYAMAQSGANYGVVGASRSPEGYGGYFYNNGGGVGLYGSSTVSVAVVGVQAGYSLDDLGSWSPPGGFFGGQNGVIGVGTTGVLGLSNDSSGWAGMFSGSGNGIRVSTQAGKVGLEVLGGTKNAVVGTDDGARLLYTEESTEVWFSDYGFGKLEDGAAIIVIDPHFAQTVNLKDEPYHVFVQVYGDAEVYVTNRTSTQFEVRLRDGDPAVEFSYRIVAKRLGYEDDRLERAPWADDDPYLYPERPGGQRVQGGDG